MKNYVIRSKKLIEILGVSRVTLWRRMKSDPTFPRPIRLGNGSTTAIGFLSSEVDDWMIKQAQNRDQKK
jgi:prophage regulatory protein